jgi:glyoxylase-like metal-dependent hydrolase (beta-lactamase superfamily II)
MSAQMQGTMRPQIYRFKLGGFEVTTILDSVVVREGLGTIYGVGQLPEAVSELARANRIDPNKFEHPFVPTLVNTGQQLILFDTGNGTLAREIPAMRGRLPDGNLRALLATAGYRPEDVDIVVLTHGHPDHIGGLLEDGKPVYPNARYVFGAAEFDFWKRNENVREARKGNRELYMKITAPFVDKAAFIKDGDDVVTGIRAVDAAGHSPGLMAFHLESEGKRLLLWADVTNHYVMSLQRPEWHVDFDDDKDKAVATRKRILDMVTADQLWVVGHHMPYPSVGFVEKASGGYRWVPASYQMNI